MPQLVPFYYLNQITYGYITLIIMIYIMSKYILPMYLRRNIARMYITKI